MTSRRRRLYDRLPATLRRPTRFAYERLLQLRAEVPPVALGRAGRRPGIPSRGSGGTSGPATRDGATILVVDRQVPEHDVHAGDLTLYHYLRILRAAGLRVIYRPDDGIRREPYASELESMGIELVTGELDLVPWFESHGPKLDRLVLARPTVARRYLRVVRRRTDARILYLAHDLHYLRERRRFEVTGDPAARSESRRLEELEGDIFRGVDEVLTFSGDEVGEIVRLAPGADVRVVTPAFYRTTRLEPSGVPEGSVDPAVPAGLRSRSHPTTREDVEVRGGSAGHEPWDVLFIGAHDHLPNRDAALVLVNEVMPLVWSEVPGARVTLVGGHVAPEIAALGGERVHVLGHVPDLAPYWQRAGVSVIPLRFGSGVKGKVIASLEAGVPVVTTAVGNEGIGLRHGLDALIGSDARELAGHVVSLHGDRALALRLADAGRRVLQERFSETAVRSSLLAALDLPDPALAEPAVADPTLRRS